MLDRLSIESNRSIRLSYLKALEQLGSDSIAGAVARLADSQWFVTRNMLCLLRDIGDPSVSPQVSKYLDHPHPKVRQEALRTCLQFRDAKAVSSLLGALGNQPEAELISAISLASLTSDPKIVARLLELLKSGSLLTYNLEIKKAAARSLAATAPRQSLPVFAIILDSRSFFHPRLHDLLKIEIIGALETWPMESVAPLLKKQQQSGSSEVARAAQFALRKMTGGKP